MEGLGFLVCFILLGLSIWWFVHDSQKNERKREKRENDIDLYLKKNEKNSVRLDIKSETTDGFIGVDKTQKKIFLADCRNIQHISMKSIDFKDIMSCELIEDGATIYKKSATRAIGGAIVGGILSGGVGAIVGGLSGSSKEKKKVKKVDLKFVVRDIDNPCVVVNFYNHDLYYEKVSTTYNLLCCIERANEWKDRISAIIDMEDNKVE